MFLRELLIKFGRKEASKITGVGQSAANNWFLRDTKNQKVPDINAIVSLAEHLDLPDATLGLIIRDAACTRVEIEFLKNIDLNNVRLDQGSLVARLFRQNKDVVLEVEPRPSVHLEKEALLNKEREDRIEDNLIEQNIIRIEHLQEKLRNI